MTFAFRGERKIKAMIIQRLTILRVMVVVRGDRGRRAARVQPRFRLEHAAAERVAHSARRQLATS